MGRLLGEVAAGAGNIPFVVALPLYENAAVPDSKIPRQVLAFS